MKSFSLTHYIRNCIANDGAKIPYEQVLTEIAVRKERLFQEAKEILYPNGFYSADERRSGLTYTSRIWIRFYSTSIEDDDPTVIYFHIDSGSRINTGHHNIVDERLTTEAIAINALEASITEKMYNTQQAIRKLVEECRSTKQLLDVWPDALPLLERHDPNRAGENDPLMARAKLAKLVSDDFNEHGCDTLIRLPASMTTETTPTAETTA